MVRNIWLGVMVVVMALPLMLNADPLKLKVAAVIEEKYNDNVFFNADNEEADFLTRFSPTVEGGRRTERTELRLSGRPDFYYYRNTTELNAVDQYYNGSLGHRWTERLNTTLSAGFLDDERPERELAETGLLFNTKRRQRWTCDLAGQYQASEAMAMALSYGYQDETFDDPQYYDLRAHKVSVLLSRYLAPLLTRSTGRLQAGYASYDYSRRYSFGNVLQTVDVDDRQSIDNYSLSVGLAHSMTERMELTVDLGARLTRQQNQARLHITDIFGGERYETNTAKEDSWGFVGSLNFEYASERSRFSLLFSHDLVPASGSNGATERTTLRLADEGRLTGDWYFDLAARAYQNRSDEKDAGSDVDEFTVQLAAGLRYVFDRRWSLGSYWRSTWIDDRVVDIDKAQNTLALQLMWNWPVLE